MKEYKEPTVDVIEFVAMDIITSSDTNPDTETDETGNLLDSSKSGNISGQQ